MAYENVLGIGDQPFTNGGAITANSFVKLDTTAGRVVACTAIADNPIGVCRDTGSATAGNEQLRVATIPGTIVKVRYGATITVGQSLMVKASGTGEVDVAAGATAFVVAEAIEAGASGEICSVILRSPAKSPTL
mgnify:CR=1 FL=1